VETGNEASRMLVAYHSSGCAFSSVNSVGFCSWMDTF